MNQQVRKLSLPFLRTFCFFPRDQGWHNRQSVQNTGKSRFRSLSHRRILLGDFGRVILSKTNHSQRVAGVIKYRREELCSMLILLPIGDNSGTINALGFAPSFFHLLYAEHNKIPHWGGSTVFLPVSQSKGGPCHCLSVGTASGLRFIAYKIYIININRIFPLEISTTLTLLIRILIGGTIGPFNLQSFIRNI